jgi:hypothetical protein
MFFFVSRNYKYYFNLKKQIFNEITNNNKTYEWILGGFVPKVINTFKKNNNKKN